MRCFSFSCTLNVTHNTRRSHFRFNRCRNSRYGTTQVTARNAIFPYITSLSFPPPASLVVLFIAFYFQVFLSVFRISLLFNNLTQQVWKGSRYGAQRGKRTAFSIYFAFPFHSVIPYFIQCRSLTRKIFTKIYDFVMNNCDFL